MIEPRIIPRDELRGSRLLVERCDPDRPRHRCRATIELGGTTYRCARQTSGLDADRGLGHHEGIHDAFAEHGDGGSVRW